MAIQKFSSFLTNDTIPSSQTLYHYTSFEAALAILQTGSMWASHYEYLNDATEAKHIFGILSDKLASYEPNQNDYSPECKRLLAHMARAAAKDQFIVSFSEVRDSLSQWRAYCSHGGVCIGVKPSAVENASSLLPDDVALGYMSAQSTLAHVRYVSTEKTLKVSEAIDELLEYISCFREVEDGEDISEMLESTLSSFACHYKHEGFSEEREWRYIVQIDEPLSPAVKYHYRTSRSMVIPYISARLNGNDKSQSELEGCFAEVIIGPGPQAELNASSLRKLLIQMGWKNLQLRCSDIPYRDW